jgi:capsular exopolysaccharide synthesis family protein
MALSNQKVVVLDVDLRKPKVHHVFSQENNIKGISTILIGEYEIEECITQTEVDGLDFIPAGPIPPNPSELIISDRFDTMLDHLKKIYDVIIIDTPPVGLVTDGMLVMEKADLPVYVMRSDYSRRIFVKTLNQLERNKSFKSLSVILNAVSLSADRSYGYGKYGFGYYEESVEEKKNFIERIESMMRNN